MRLGVKFHIICQMRILSVFFVLVMLSSICSATTFDFNLYPSLMLKHFGFGVDYQNADIDGHLFKHKTADMYLFGLHKNIEFKDWLDFTIGLDGQKTSNAYALSGGVGFKIKSGLFGWNYSMPFYMSYYNNGGMLMDYGFNFYLSDFILGYKGLAWLRSSETGAVENYWTLGYRITR